LIKPAVIMGAMLLISLASGFASAQSTQPAPAATPKEALSRLSDALRDGDVSAIVALVDAPSEPAGKVAAAMARFDGGLAELHRAAVSVFGEDKGAAVVGDETASAELSQSAIDAAQVKVDGNHAIVTYENPEKQFANLIKTDQGWKVQLDELDSIAITSHADSSAQMFDDLTVTAHKMAIEITQHKFHTAEKAAEAWRNRMLQAAAPTTGPATRE
jgi:hypothetical protein